MTDTGGQPCGDCAINSCSLGTRREKKRGREKGKSRYSNLVTSQPAFSATSGGTSDRNGRKISTTSTIKVRRGVPRLSAPQRILACTSTDHSRRGTNRVSRDHISFSQRARSRGCPAIWSRYSEAPNMSYRHENWSPFGRLFGDRERHYHEYKHPTTAILMVVRSQQATPPGCQESHVPTASALPRCQENAHSLLASRSFPRSFSFSLSLLLDPSCNLAFCPPLVHFLPLGEVPS